MNAPKKALFRVLLVVLLFVVIVTSACDEPPEPGTVDNPITAPVTNSLEQKIIDVLDGDAPQNTLNGGHP